MTFDKIIYPHIHIFTTSISVTAKFLPHFTKIPTDPLTITDMLSVTKDEDLTFLEFCANQNINTYYFMSGCLWSA